MTEELKEMETEKIQDAENSPDGEKNSLPGSNPVSENAVPEEELAKAKKEIDSLKDSWARERAEFQNYKRRTAQEMLNMKRDVAKGLVSRLITPLDDLERVVSNALSDAGNKAICDGIEMIRKSFFSILEKENIFKFDPAGEIFDPMSMEAISSEESENYTEEKVIEVYQSGYHMVADNNERIIIRPARVKVGRPK